MRSLYRECVSLGEKLSSEDSVYVFAESCLYLLGATGAFDFQDHIRKFAVTKSPKLFRLGIKENRYSNLDIKLYLLRLPTVDKLGAKKLAVELGIRKIDALIIWTLYAENSWFRKAVNAYCKSNKFTSESVSMRYIEATFNRIYPDVLKFIKHITFTKLRFLVKSTNSEFSEFHSELALKIVQSYYSTVPTTMSDAHLTNYLKRIVHNHAINMIESGVTQKRGRLVSTLNEAGDRQYSMLCMSQNQMPMTNNELGDVDGVDESSNLFELRFSISEVLDKAKANSRKYRFLTLLLGAEDSMFSDFLRVRGLCKENEDNVDVQNRLKSNQYTKLISEFLQIPKVRVDSLFESLRTQLAWG